MLQTLTEIIYIGENGYVVDKNAEIKKVQKRITFCKDGVFTTTYSQEESIIFEISREECPLILYTISPSPRLENITEIVVANEITKRPKAEIEVMKYMDTVRDANLDIREGKFAAFIAGYKVAQKGFSEAQLRIAYEDSCKYRNFDDLLQSLKSPKQIASLTIETDDIIDGRVEGKSVIYK